MKLYWSDVLAPRKVCAVAKYLESPLDYAYLDLSRGEHRKPLYLALNPNGKVPTLVDDNRVLWEADAIMCHLAARCDSELWPQDARQTDVIRWFSWNAQHFTANAGTLYFEHIIKSRFGVGDPDAVAVKHATEEWRRYAAILDDHLRARRWLVGESLTVADFALAVALPYAKPACIPLDDFAAVKRWHERLNELDAWREPFPELAMAE